MPRPSSSEISGSQEGFSLIELLIYMLMSTAVLAILVSIFASVFTVQDSVMQSGDSTSELQTISNSISHGVRNSTALQLTTSSVGQVLVVETQTGADQVGSICQAWFYKPSLDTLYTATGAAKADLPSSSSTEGWTLLSDNIHAVGSTSMFSASGSTLEFAMKSTNTKGLITEFSNRVTGQGQNTGGSLCF